MIRNFLDKKAAAFFYNYSRDARFNQIEKVVRRKLAMLNSASALNEVGNLPGNRLEKLGGERKGQWSIRINDQWRICFRWGDDGPFDVEIVDYH